MAKFDNMASINTFLVGVEYQDVFLLKVSTYGTHVRELVCRKSLNVSRNVSAKPGRREKIKPIGRKIIFMVFIKHYLMKAKIIQVA